MLEILRWIALITGWPYQILFFKRKTYYEDKKSQSRFIKGGALIISNHYSVYDFIVNLFLFPFRKLYVVMAEMIFKIGKPANWITKFFGGIRSDRDIKGMRFIDESVKLLEKGKLVQIYPEAHPTTDGKMLPFKLSYIMIALRANVPIIPVITDGNYGWFKRVHLIIGKKIYLSDYCTSLNPTREEIIKLNEIVYQKALELQNELHSRINKKESK